MSHLPDSVLLLRYVREAGRLQRALTVLETRASSHDPVISRFEITGDGITLLKGSAPPSG